eukprot:GHRQ01038464.1.p3 GENE.GHRQ01038464.1~~GHRQ01038464.1.p3  ORF type:complete len:101 (-),score=7.43 GHRQ01038464.1:186-488(-)
MLFHALMQTGQIDSTVWLHAAWREMARCKTAGWLPFPAREQAPNLIRVVSALQGVLHHTARLDLVAEHQRAERPVASSTSISSSHSQPGEKLQSPPLTAQ